VSPLGNAYYTWVRNAQERCILTNFTANKFCQHCGNALIETAVICPKCGSPTPRFGEVTGQGGSGGNGGQVRYAQEEKSKTVSVVLALFLGIWTYLYTYKKDAGLFWVSLSVQFLLAFGIVASPGGSASEGAILFILFLFGIVALIVTGSRPSEWYKKYPNN